MSDHHITAHDQIHYLIPVPHPLGSCAFQGFSRGILEVSFFLRYIARMPSSMRNFQEPKSVLRAQRAAGLDFYDVHFVPVQQLAELRVRTPFAVIFSEQSTVRDVMAWLAATPSAQLLHVSCVDEKGVLHIRHFNRRTLRRHCIESLRRLIASGNDKFQSALDALSPSTPLRRRPLPFPQRYHNTVVPNEITLFSAGMQFLQTKPFIPSTDDSECTSAIAASAEKILALRSNSNLSIAGRTPSLILTTAGLSREIVKEWQSKRHFKDPALEMTQLGIRIMQSQRGYFHTVDSDTARKFITDPNLQSPLALRAEEHASQTDALTIRAASELSAVIRLPARASTCHQKMIQFASCFRGGSARRRHKLWQAYEELLAELRLAVPDRIYEVIRAANEGLRVVSDIPFEWLPSANQLPLMFERECSRIPTTPGDLLLQQLLPRPPVVIDTSSLREILVVRSFRAGDKLAKLIETAASAYLQGSTSLRLRFVDCANASELYAAFNSFNGAIAIFDGHGRRTDSGSALCVGSEYVTATMLAASARIPPAVILAACDTHAMDGTPSSAASGMLAAGARTVMGSLLPVDGARSSIFVGRLVSAIVRLVPALLKEQNGFVRWSTLMSRVLRGQLLHECMFSYVGQLNDPTEYLSAMTYCIAVIASGHPRWLSLSLERLSLLTKVSLKTYSDLLRFAGRIPDVLAYVQMGDPHSLILARHPAPEAKPLG